MKLIKADKSYNERLIAFYQCNVYAAQTDVELIRKIDFFKHYEMQSNDHVTYLLTVSYTHLTLPTIYSV